MVYISLDNYDEGVYYYIKKYKKANYYVSIYYSSNNAISFIKNKFKRYMNKYTKDCRFILVYNDLDSIEYIVGFDYDETDIIMI